MNSRFVINERSFVDSEKKNFCNSLRGCKAVMSLMSVSHVAAYCACVAGKKSRVKYVNFYSITNKITKKKNRNDRTKCKFIHKRGIKYKEYVLMGNTRFGL